MEGDSEQSRRGNLNQLCGNLSSGERTPNTSRHDETSRNYNGSSVNSGRDSRRVDSSSEKTVGFEPRLSHGGDVSSGEKTPKGESLKMEQVRSSGVTETSHKRERFNDEVQIDIAAGELTYGTGSNSVRRRHSNQSSSSHCARSPREPDTSRRKNVKDDRALRKSEGKKNRKRQGTSKGYGTSTEDSACSVFRGHWNENIKLASKLYDTETSDVFMMQRFVEGQSKALDLAHEQNDNLDLVNERDHKGKDKHLTERKAVAAVLTFQRWRHTQLKRLFSLELKKVLEEAKEDEACLAKLEQDMATKDRHIAQLRNQLSSYENAFDAQTVQRNAIDANVHVPHAMLSS
ncbi:hypothetical protein R1sor_009898 [Riccia sorocarpa]|uniref:Uncharacterized protein n=1 Tax=Riccia sorocarpa TaxID=122646 RepID=A0ABD3HWF0_9MARC